jgi:hypothetical protein
MDAVRNQLQQLDAALRVADQTGTIKGADNTASLTEAINTVKAGLQRIAELRDAKVVRPLPGLGYRQFPRLREELQSLSGAINGAAARPTAGQVLRLNELKGETTQIVGEVDATLNTVIRDVNAKIAGKPFIIITE